MTAHDIRHRELVDAVTREERAATGEMVAGLLRYDPAWSVAVVGMVVVAWLGRGR